MFEVLKETIVGNSAVTTEEFEEIKQHFLPKKLKKKQLLLEPGDVCTRLAFVEKGALFAYSNDEKGGVRIVQFAFEGWWIADLYSYFTKEPSNLTIEALEDCELLIIREEVHEALLQQYPHFENYVRNLYQKAYVALQRRVEGTVGLTAEEKYNRFARSYPHMMARVPQHLIASYLGITPETLSRIRKQRMAVS